MTVEFALRPRIRLREGFAPARRQRARLAKIVLPVAGYWLGMAALTYGFVCSHEALPLGPSLDSVSSEPPRTVTPRAWWQRTPEASQPLALASESPSLEGSNAAPEPAHPIPVRPLEAYESNPEHTSSAEVQPPELPPGSHPPGKAARSPTASPPTRAATRPLADSVDPAAEPFASLLPKARPEPPEPVEGTPRRDATTSGRELPSCEAAIASATQELDFSQGNRTADLPSQAIAAVLENGSWLSTCQVPSTTTLDVCVAIRAGAVVGASVSSSPRDPVLSACVRGRAAGLRFPFSPHLDLARTRF